MWRARFKTQAAPASDAHSHRDLHDEVEIGSTSQAIVTGWTNWTSDGLAPVSCGGVGARITKIACRGKYCDDIRIHCAATGIPSDDTGWYGYFSEENGSSQYQGNGLTTEWTTGIACKGAYCDEISEQWQTTNSQKATHCSWVGVISEEDGVNGLPMPPGYFLHDIACYGSYCDELQIRACKH